MSEKNQSFIDISKLKNNSFKSYSFKIFNINNKQVYRIYEDFSKKDEDFIFESEVFEEAIKYAEKLMKG